jgi:hypothetical protein
MSRKKLVLLPCAVCGSSCQSDKIDCLECRKWVHKDCARLDDVDFNHFSERSVRFQCPACLGVGDGDFSGALARFVVHWCLLNHNFLRD